MADYRAGRPASTDLAQCLAFDLAPDMTGALRQRLLAGGWKPVLALAADLRLLPALAMAAEAKGLTAGIPRLRSMTGDASVPALLADALAEHEQRSTVLRQRLGEILGALAARDIEPVLLKGARALWTGAPAWRSLRDFDLLVPPPLADAAVATALAAGYRPNPAFSAPTGWHHGAELYRDDLPGWLEIHQRGGVRRIEVLLPTQRLLSAAERAPLSTGGRGALVLPTSLHILYCLAHHHVGHRGDYYGVIDFKGLYEFAADVDALDASSRDHLLRTAREHPRLVAILDLWLAAAADVFRLAVRPPLRLAGDANYHWGEVKARASVPGRPAVFAGLGCEVAMALQGSRIAQLRGGGTVLGRLGLRIQALRAIATRATDAK